MGSICTFLPLNNSNIFTLSVTSNSLIYNNKICTFCDKMFLVAVLKIFIFCSLAVIYYIFKTQYCTPLKADILYSIQFYKKKICTSIIFLLLHKWLCPAPCIFPLQTDLLCFLETFTAATFALCISHFCTPLINSNIFIIHIKSELCIGSLACVIHYSQTGYLHVSAL